jgi:hypothetical protein
MLNSPILALPPMGTPSLLNSGLENWKLGGVEVEAVREIVPVLDVVPTCPVKGIETAPAASVLAAVKRARSPLETTVSGQFVFVEIPDGRVTPSIVGVPVVLTEVKPNPIRKLLPGKMLTPCGTAQKISAAGADAGKVNGFELGANKPL